MHAKGTITIGGVAFGAVTIDMETDDGNKYHFSGYYADAGVGVGVCDDAEGDFPGLSHIIGGCFLEVAAVPGGMGIAFNDFHGEIGQLGGVFKGAVVNVGVGGGTWSSASDAAELKPGDHIRLELDHVLVTEEGVGGSATSVSGISEDYAESAE